VIQTPMPVSSTTGWQERPHLTEFGGDPMIRFRFNGKLYHVSPDMAVELSDDELAAKFARPFSDVANDLFGGE